MTDTSSFSPAPAAAPATTPRAPEAPREPPAPPRAGGGRRAAARRARRLDPTRAVGQGLTILGAVVLAYFVYLVAGSRLEYGRSQRQLIRTMRSELSSAQAPIGGRIDPGTPVALLDIPRLHVRAAVVEGTSGSQLRRAPGHLRTSPLPGQRGNVVLMGRRVAYGGPFRNLGKLERGDLIQAATGQGKATYVVNGVRTTKRNGTDVLRDTSGNHMTLVTSSPELLAERRLVVDATLRGDPVLTPFGRPLEVGQDELGLRGDGSTVTSLLLWAELLLLAAVGSAWLYRRWGGWNSYLVTTPVIVLLLLLVFDSLTPVLPATL